MEVKYEEVTNLGILVKSSDLILAAAGAMDPEKLRQDPEPNDAEELDTVD